MRHAQRKYFVCAMPHHLRGKLLDLPRLYAFPAEPELPPPADGFIILDSGAFAAGGKALGKTHAERLYMHYRKFAAERVVCIMPDTLFDYQQTLKMWRWWLRTYPDVRVAPVVQCERRGDAGVYSTMQSMAEFGKHVDKWPRLFGRPFIAWSNSFMLGLDALERGVKTSITIVRRYAPGAWIHVLGAGWDVADMRAWLVEIGADSVDTIAYYTGQENTADAVEEAKRLAMVAASLPVSE